MAKIERRVKTLVEILDEEEIVNPPRGYLGLSEIGGPCRRSMYYSFHWAHSGSISQRLKRIFDTGHFMEEFMIKSLKNSGFLISREQETIDGLFGHIKGHIDGVVKGIPGYEDEELLIEFKTMNDANFNAMTKRGVRVSKPTHYSQMQMYMSGIGLKHAVYFAYNKNNSKYYIEIIELDQHFVDEKNRSIMDLLTEGIIPPRIGEGNPTWYECKFCNNKPICHDGEHIDENCRTCKHVDIEPDGKWTCGYQPDSPELDIEAQRKGCRAWSINETLNGET